MSVATLIAAVPVVMAMNTAYVKWHDDRYPRRSEVMLIAQYKDLHENWDETAQVAQENAQKLNYLVKVTARDDVRHLKEQMAVLQEKDDGSPLYKRQVLQLQLEIDRAEDYYECLRMGRDNCESER